MHDLSPQPPPLTEAQKVQVSQNVGLVAIHLRRRMNLRGEPTRDCEREDLFQEGCLGLIQAVRSFDPSAGIPFAAYALPRIHTAVSRATQTAFATVRKPLIRQRKHQNPVELASVSLLDFEPEHREADPRHQPDSEDSETLGTHLRSRFEQTLRSTVANMRSSKTARVDRDKLAQLIIDERLLIPEESARHSLRVIARQTNSSYARVAQCEKKIVQQARQALSADPVTQFIRDKAKTSPNGLDTPMGDRVRHELAQQQVQHFREQFRSADAAAKSRFMLALVERSADSAESFVCNLFARMSDEQRTQLLSTMRTRGPRHKKASSKLARGLLMT